MLTAKAELVERPIYCQFCNVPVLISAVVIKVAFYIAKETVLLAEFRKIMLTQVESRYNCYFNDYW